ncbi:hypothetical protein I601_2173 [Nocardioides dokdonensis FR1436]|uniref:Cupin domain protein n=1 Tax=Nocardioides dokdonensis FR1436 TaxID=1300347 RepID=A0A1A9GJZ9_9ACTN|nr:hypothetical protein I601_2173 [Nocardioides dokdonensis FR1436]
MTLQTPSILGAGEGEHWHFLNTLQTLKVDGARSDGAKTALVFEGPRGFGPPLHSHDVEDREGLPGLHTRPVRRLRAHPGHCCRERHDPRAS